MAAVATARCPSTATAALSCSHRRPNNSVAQSASPSHRLARPCVGLRHDSRLDAPSSQQQVQAQRARIGTGRQRQRQRRGRGGAGVRAGLPVVSSVPVLGPLANAVFNPVVLLLAYAAGAFKFYSGFRKTTYADSSATKISLTALWPVLFLVSQNYRSNFKKAIS